MSAGESSECDEPESNQPPMGTEIPPAGLSKFQLRILAVLNDINEPPKGVTVKRRLQEYYDKPVNHGQLYPNLDRLVEAGFVAKGAKDQRTNSYEITNAGREALNAEIGWLVDRVDAFEEEDA